MGLVCTPIPHKLLSVNEYLVAVLALLAGVALMAPATVVFLRRAVRAESDLDQARLEAEETREILAAAPDGLFLWDLVAERERCSPRLAVLLGLEAGLESTFADVLRRFEGDAVSLLEQAVARLRRDGAFFDLILPAAGRMVHVVGARAASTDGRVWADLLWMRDAATEVEPAASTDLAEDDQFRALLDALPVGVWLRDSNLQVAFVNNAGRELAGKANEIAIRARSERRMVTEPRLISDDDGRRPMEVTETPLEGWPGTLGFAVCRPTESNGTAQYEKVLDNLSTPVAVFGPDTRLTYFNSNFVTLWHLSRSWLETEPTLGQFLDALRAERRLPEYADYRAFRQEQIGQFGRLEGPTESLMHLPDGSTLRSLVAPHPAGGLVFTWEDVTDRLALERSYNTLIAVQRATLDNLYEGVAVFGSNGLLKLSNPVFDVLWSLNGDEMANDLHITGFIDRMRPFLTIADEDWPGRREQLVAELMSRKPGGGRILRADGTVLDHGHVPLPDGAVLLGYLDVTDSVRVQHALRQRAEALQEADRLKSHFMANVSYEVRTPLNTIIGFAELLAAEYFGPLNSRQSEYTQGILETSQHLMAVMGDIIDLATIEAGLMRLELDTVDLHGVLAGVLGLVRERARRKSLKLELDCPTDIGWMVADERRLRQVVFNLLSNAVTFTPANGRVSLSALREQGRVLLAVTDTGVGIAKDDLSRVFETFERGPALEAQGSGGPGLGLSLVKRFVELHGGHVEIRSTVGQGTTVTCFLPTEANPAA